jgi:hypothetical protein
MNADIMIENVELAHCRSLPATSRDLRAEALIKRDRFAQ